ncbi:flagellin [Pseudoduganella sp. GCM10020061]|uniref:flagellin N-terminal helical domain-containing protein n=1 Tax=Pseudoduganella sp. GCM10020061 TaxID=3317345 RepID=UPI0036276C8A
MSVINTNVSSLNAQRNLSGSQSALATSLQRLSTGLRINSAKDDAAGMAIAERMTSQIRGNDQAARNANDGISLAQTAEGDLAQIGTNLQRIRELAVQASNASNSASDRKALNEEATALISEIDRVANNSSFNGNKLLDGSFTAQTFQVGANNTAQDRISIASIASAKSNSLGVGSGSSYSTTMTTAGTMTSAAFTAGGVTINGYSVGASSSDGVSSVNADGSAIAKAAAINAISAQTGVTAQVQANKVEGAVAGTPATGWAGGATDFVKINGVDIGAVDGDASAVVLGSNLAAAINKVSNQTGVTASVATDGKVTMNAADGRNIDVELGGAATTATTGLTDATTVGSFKLVSTSKSGITLGGTEAAAAGALGIASGYTAATETVGAGVSSLDLTTASGAQSALSTIDKALATVNSSRASLGAYQNRFASVVSSLQTTSENLSASRSRIQDADFAKETATLTRGQILQQAGTAMLAQANSLPNGVLSLLRG